MLTEQAVLRLYYYVMEALKKRKKMHLDCFDYTQTGYVYFVTICCNDKKTFFCDKSGAQFIVDELDYYADVNIDLFCYCVMPEHVHVLLSLKEEYLKSLQDWVTSFKKYTTRKIREQFNISSLCQKNFYDHIVRKEESLLKIAEYILHNPVRKELVEVGEEYPFSRLNM